MRFTLSISLFIALVLGMQSAPAPRYVAAWGAGTECSADAPCTLASQLLSSAAPGEVWLLPGVYNGSFVANAPGVTYRSVPGTRARIDGSLSIIAPDTTWQGLEITDTRWQAGRNVSTESSLYIYGARTRVLDSWIHDLADGVGVWKPATGAELRGNLIYNNGYAPNVGHSVYAQNVLGTGRKTIKDNIIGPAYGMGLHVYSSAGANATSGFVIDRNIVLDQWLVGGGAPSGDIRVTSNILSGAPMRLGYTAVNTDVAVLENTVIAPSYTFQLYRWKQAVVRGNTFIGTGGNFIVDRIDAPGAILDWDANTYRYGGTYTQPFGYPSFAAWQATGVDSTSVYTPTLPTQNDIRVWSTGPHRGMVSVLNWTGAQTVTLDLAPLALTPGAAYRLVNAQNPAEALAFTAGAPVSIPMTGWTAATPYGASAPLRAWDSRFAVFLIEPGV